MRRWLWLGLTAALILGLAPGCSKRVPMELVGGKFDPSQNVVVTFQDGTRSKKIYGRDFDANGLAYVAFNYPKGTTTSVCHTLKVYDSKGVLIGTR